LASHEEVLGANMKSTATPDDSFKRTGGDSPHREEDPNKFRAHFGHRRMMTFGHRFESGPRYQIIGGVTMKTVAPFSFPGGEAMLVSGYI
jgi:hypothetical protein